MSEYGLLSNTDPGADSATPGGLEGSVEVSHLDSFFATSGWTREDVMLVLGAIQVAAWLALLYLEVSD